MSLALQARAEIERRRRENQWSGLHPGQSEVVTSSTRFNVVDCGRRWGKTLLGTKLCKPTISQGHHVGWFAPSYKLMLEVWDELRRSAAGLLERSNKTEMRMHFKGGGTLDLWSLDNVDAGRGRRYHLVIVDEAAMVRNLIDAWQYSVRPTLTDFRGGAWFFSTPKGRNGFWQMYQWGLDPLEPDWSCWQMPTASNPYIDAEEIEAARRSLPERVFQQEYLAEFLEDSGYVFRRVNDAVAECWQEHNKDGHQYVIGVDWGKMNDFTVITVIDVAERAVCYIDRFNQIDYHIQVERLIAVCERFSPMSVVVELNSMGHPLAESLSRAGVPVVGFTTTNATKTAIIDALSLAFERGEISLPNDPVLLGELMSYDMERLPSGMMRYSAPEGQHDDCVMSLAFAWSEIYDPALQQAYAEYEEDVSISPY